MCPMPHDHDLAAELLLKNIIWVEFLGPRSILWSTPILFLAWQYPLGVIASARIRAGGSRGARIGNARNEAQPRLV